MLLSALGGAKLRSNVCVSPCTWPELLCVTDGGWGWTWLGEGEGARRVFMDFMATRYDLIIAGPWGDEYDMMNGTCDTLWPLRLGHSGSRISPTRSSRFCLRPVRKRSRKEFSIKMKTSVSWKVIVRIRIFNSVPPEHLPSNASHFRKIRVSLLLNKPSLAKFATRNNK